MLRTPLLKLNIAGFRSIDTLVKIDMKLRNAVHHLDCLKGFSKIPTGTVDLLVTDPPFNIGYDYDEYDDRQEMEHYLQWSRRWGAEICRVLKANGTFWLAIGDEYAAELKLLFQKDLGLTCRSWVIWYYTFGVNCTRKFNRSHAHLFHFVKDAERFTFNADAIRIPSARSTTGQLYVQPKSCSHN